MPILSTEVNTASPVDLPCPVCRLEMISWERRANGVAMTPTTLDLYIIDACCEFCGVTIDDLNTRRSRKRHITMTRDYIVFALKAWRGHSLPEIAAILFLVVYFLKHMADERKEDREALQRVGNDCHSSQEKNLETVDRIRNSMVAAMERQNHAQEKHAAAMGRFEAVGEQMERAAGRINEKLA